MWRTRHLAGPIAEDALGKRKIALLSGPRQVGKSTLARSLLAGDTNYFLYDELGFRRKWSKSAEDKLAPRCLALHAALQII